MAYGSHMQRWNRPLTDETGVALVITLVIVTLVSVIVLELNYLMRVDIHTSANFRDGVRSYYLAKSGVTVVKELFSRDVQELEELKNTLLAGGSHTLPIGDGSTTVRVIDETGKVNVNAFDGGTAAPQSAAGAQAAQSTRRTSRGAQPQQAPTDSPWIQITQDLFQRLGIDPMLVGAIKDWIDVDDIPTGSGGAERSYYRSLDKPYTARNGPMETIGELRLIKGFTDEVLLKLGARRVGGIIDPATNLYLTALPAQGGWKVNINTAPAAILNSLTQGVGQFGEIILQRRAQSRITKIRNDLQQLGISGEALDDFENRGSVDSLYYTVDARGTVGDMVKQINALIRRDANQGSQTLNWRVQ